MALEPVRVVASGDVELAVYAWGVAPVTPIEGEVLVSSVAGVGGVFACVHPPWHDPRDTVRGLCFILLSSGLAIDLRVRLSGRSARGRWERPSRR